MTSGIIFENDDVVQFEDGTMLCKGCGDRMTFDGIMLGRNQYTCYTVNCPTGDRLTRIGNMVPVINDSQDRKRKWEQDTKQSRIQAEVDWLRGRGVSENEINARIAFFEQD